MEITKVILGILMLVGLFCLYFLPAIIARKSKYYDGVLIINLFLGWTLIGWVAALVWAVSAPKK